MSTAAGTLPSVPLFDLRLRPDDLAAVGAVLRSGRLAAGPEVEAFEETFARHLGVRHALCVSSCTAALHLAYRAAGVGPGTEVVVPSTTFAATATAAIHAGARPVFADVVGDHDPGVDPTHVATLIGPRTAAVSVVHFAGYPAAVEELRELCDRRGVALIEDAAHAPLADRGGRALGTFGRLGAFSFFANKVLSGGEGGLVATDDDEAAATVQRLRAEGDHVLDDVRAALLRSRLAGLADDVERRRGLVRRYRSLLAGVDGLTVPFADEEVDRSSCYVMPVVVDEPARRDPLRRTLSEEHRIQTSLLYPAVHEFSAYVDRFGPLRLPGAERWARTEVTLPLFPHLRHDEQDRVVDAVARGLAA